jgi:hypothetical protein
MPRSKDDARLTLRQVQHRHDVPDPVPAVAVVLDAGQTGDVEDAGPEPVPGGHRLLGIVGHPEIEHRGQLVAAQQRAVMEEPLAVAREVDRVRVDRRREQVVEGLLGVGGDVVKVAVAVDVEPLVGDRIA